MSSNKTSENKGKDIRVQFRFTPAAFKELEDLAQREGRNMTQVVERALTKEKWFIDTIQAGGKIIVEKTDGSTHQVCLI